MSAPPPKRRRHTGARVNPLCPEPTPPGDWVDADVCIVCDETYDEFKAGITFDDGVLALRQAAAADGDTGGGYRSRRAVLWRMRVLKLEAWYRRHCECGRCEPEPAEITMQGDSVCLNGVPLF